MMKSRVEQEIHHSQGQTINNIIVACFEQYRLASKDIIDIRKMQEMLNWVKRFATHVEKLWTSGGGVLF